jgi:hydroxymethylpyrimidine/phosphomethylpyrimidine kinase
MHPTSPARVLIIAGSDSGGGAGIQADTKTVTLLGGYAATAITALTAQNTQGVQGVHPAPPAFVAQQIQLVLEDIGADALKTGMLFSAEIIEAVAAAIAPYPQIPLVLDPVMVAKGGTALLREDAVAALRTHLLPRATVLTPNIPEAELFTGRTIRTEADMADAAQQLLAEGARAVLMKGGHLDGDICVDLLFEANGASHRWASPRIHTRHTHGTGCTLASAIAAGLAQSLSLAESVGNARDYVQGALKHAPALGHGHGPLGHGWVLPQKTS